jgi:hypothetical protein
MAELSGGKEGNETRTGEIQEETLRGKGNEDRKKMQ